MARVGVDDAADFGERAVERDMRGQVGRGTQRAFDRLPSRSVITMSAGVIFSYGTPLGLMTHRPCSRDTALALPKV